LTRKSTDQDAHKDIVVVTKLNDNDTKGVEVNALKLSPPETEGDNVKMTG